MRLGVLDVGSNSVHLLVVDAHYGAAPVPAHSHKIELRLAENSKRNGNDKVEIAPKTVDKLSAFVDSALKVAEDQGVTEILTFATSAIREAENGDQVLDIVAEQTGLSIEVLDGDDLSELLVQLANIGLSRYKAPSVWPIPVKYLNECAAREGAAGESDSHS